MTDWEAERFERTARRSAVNPHGGSPLMPSHSQGAERRPERRAGRTGSRWRRRALVVCGLARCEPAVDGLLEAAVQPPEPEPKNHLLILTTPVVPLDETGGALPCTASASPRTSGGTADGRALPAPSGPVAEPVITSERMNPEPVA
ncbi:hypothetical protein BC793_1399 [Actinoplanes xinjiangensis]|jgi:hypothetical protein|uniref:Uncharacterized protein n=1 Tax=Actinoplanes xinjiangensis TaxID=512350 RepID=A0A316EHZ0_9ACTN|nr:hypothetical protein BC793_1399 [Actinoplanes xinjiangensis]GIF44381.1 hypothetical protein Axi01nite_86920 [Actinoplanes xinjiangensis]